MNWRFLKYGMFSFLFVALMGCGTTGLSSAGPVVPTTIPTTIEGIGGETSSGEFGETSSGEFTVMTGNTLSFAVTGSDGGEADASVVTVEFFTPEGTPVADSAESNAPDIDKSVDAPQCYGSTSASGSSIIYTAGDCFPNRESKVVVRFSYGDTEIGTADIFVSINPEHVENGILTFDGGTEILSRAVNPGISVTADGILFVCARRSNYTESCGARGCGETESSRDLVVLKSEDLGATWSDPVVVTTWDTSSTLNSAPMCSISAFDGSTVAVGYPAIVTTTEQVCGRVCVDVETSYDYYYVAFGSDDGSGLSFGTPIQAGRLSSTYESDSISDGVKDIGVAYDANGILHVVYQTMEYSGSLVANAYYRNCTSASCSSAVTVNSTANSVYTANRSLPIAVTGTDTVSIFTSWQSTADGSQYSSMHMGKIEYSGGAARLVRNVRVDEDQYGWTAGQNLIVDREGRLLATWTGANRQQLVSTIYLAQLGEDGTSFESNSAVSQPAVGYFPLFSHIATDYSNSVHIIYADYPLGDQADARIRYLMGTLSDGTFSAVPTVDILDGLPSRAEMSFTNDLAGRGFVVWHQDDGSGYSNVYLSVGTIPSP